MIKNKCLYCGTEFISKIKKKYCNEECGYKYRYNKVSKKKCKFCGKEFNKKGNKLYCSKECKEKQYKIIVGEMVCKHCGKKFKPDNNAQKYCSPECRNEKKREFDRIRHRLNRKKNSNIIKMCEHCGKEFKTHNEDQRFCSVSCVANYTQNAEKYYKTCKYCGKNFIGKMNSEYCSEECKKEFFRKPKFYIKCEECGKIYLTNREDSKTCSTKCSKRRQRRRDRLIRDERLKQNKDSDWDITLSKLIKRDKNKCHICGGECDENDYIIKDGVFIVGKTYPSIDHLIPISKGGTHTWDNVKLAHHYCNSVKNDNLIYKEAHG